MGDMADMAIEDGLASLFTGEDCYDYDIYEGVWPLPYKFKRSAVDVFYDYRVPDDQAPDKFE